MPFQATVKNRQRQVRLNNKKLNALANLVLHSAVCVLSQAKLKQAVKRKAIAEFERRGILNITIVSDRRIKELNYKWRGVDTATDVLSFPLGPLMVTSPDISFEMGVETGEIVISIERAIKQARQYNHSLEREMAFLLTHGFLHVLGFDHDTKKKELEMFRLQRKVLDKAGIRRAS